MNILLTRTFIRLTALYIVIGFITRIVLLSTGQIDAGFSFVEWLQIFGLGIINDLCVAVIGFFFMWLCIIFFSESKYRRPWGYLILAAIGLALCYVVFFNTIFDEYGSVVPEIVKGLLTWKLISFGTRLFLPNIRKRWSEICYYAVFFISVGTVLMTAVGEYFFWDEFGVRYNFIAVDYLVYTNEVVGNIIESYPIVPLMLLLGAVTGLITWWLARKSGRFFEQYPTLLHKITLSALWIALCVLAVMTLNFNTRFQTRKNVYVNELQANGAYKFIQAFRNSELSYMEFYSTLPTDEVAAVMRGMYHRQIADPQAEIHKNIVLITIESMSASYLARYGNSEGLTPSLDSLMRHSLVFDNLFATGNRTVRGLEAVTLCLPPSPGESLIKRPNNANLFSTGKVLSDRGYTVRYLYGGDSYFDNMQTFFGGNGYQITDKKNFAKDEITFSNIWGVCDEDMFRKAISVFNADAASGKPFFGHIVTVSNHRPFTYPDGKIDIPSTSKSRKGGIKYTDYALGRFIEEASKQSWFDNTVFVIVADHCASSSGKTEIPLAKYHIPALIYAPGFIAPQSVETLVSQIDLMPTLFGLLNLNYDSQFYGQDIFAEGYVSRAFVATYQNMGYWRDDIFTILSPVRKVEQYRVSPDADLELTPVEQIDSVYLKEAIANYQSMF